MASNLRLVSEQVGASSFYRLDARMMAIPAVLEPSRRFRMERDGFGLPTLLDDISGYDPERFIALKNEFCEYFPEFRTIHLGNEQAATRTHQAVGLYQSGVAPGKGIYFETQAGANVRAPQASDGAILFLGFLSLFYLPTPPKLLLIEEPETRLSSLCSFRTLYFTPESGPATEGFSCRGAVMNDEGNAARKIRKLRASRDLWKQRSAEKQQEIRQLRVTVRDLSSSRENWKTRVKELEQQLQAAHEAHAAVGPGSWIFFGGLMDNQAMPRTRRTPITLSSD